MYPVDAVRDLGVKLCVNFSWTPHINQVSSRARQVSGWVLSVFKDRGRCTMLTLYKSFIRSHLEYCCPLWHPHNSVANTQTLENVQRVFTSKIQGHKAMDYWSRLKSLNWMSLQRRRERFIIIYIWKIMQGLAPNDISLSWHYNDRLGIKMIIPPHKKNCLLKDTIAVIGPRLWNMLPKRQCYSTINRYRSERLA